MNLERFAKIVEHIEAHPEQWYQPAWCGSACCVGGHAQLAAGKASNPMTVRADALEYLELTTVPNEPCWLFFGYRTIADFHAVLNGERDPVTGALLRRGRERAVMIEEECTA